MTLKTSEVRAALDGRIWVADVGTDFPDTISDVVDDADWIDLGFATEDGVHPTFDRTSKDIGGWQSRESLRTLITAVPKKVDFVLRQWNQNTWALACGGGTWTGVDPDFEYEPPDNDFVDERAGIIEWSDGDLAYRVLVRKWLNKSPLDFMLRADDAVNLPISMSILTADDGLKSWGFQTNDDALGDAASAGS